MMLGISQVVTRDSLEHESNKGDSLAKLSPSSSENAAVRLANMKEKSKARSGVRDSVITV